MNAENKKEIAVEIGHVLFMDIVHYSNLLLEEQREVVEELSQIVRECERFRAAEAAGELVSLPAGDGMALVFTRTVEAPVYCAMEITRKLKTHPELRVRMGIHSGPVSGVTDVNARSNIAGAGINIAQRVMDQGDAGHILLSKHVADDLEQYRHWRPHLHDLGECEIKHGRKLGLVNFYNDEVGNLERPAKCRAMKIGRPGFAAQRWMRIAAALGLLVIVAAAIAYYRFSHRPRDGRAIPEKSIAVLPFENRSEDKANAYFAEGIQDEILTRLAKIAALKVISRTSTEHYRSKPESLSDVANELGVAHILEGSVQKSGDTVRVNVQLIKAANDSHLWGETFDRKLTDIFSVESEIAKNIADQLSAHLSGRENQVIAAKPTDNPAAYDAYLRGLAYSFKALSTPANTLNAQKYLKEAVRLDPKFAMSWALLSYVDSASYLSINLQRTPALRDEARQAAETALTLQPKLGEALLAKGYYYYACERNYDAAVGYFEQARQFLPNSSQIVESLAYVARRQGQWDRSDFYFNEAERLDPRNVKLLTQHALSYIALRRFSEGVQKLDQVLALTPGDIDSLALKAAIAQAEGDLPRAAALLSTLHLTADNSSALEIVAYQAILDRQPKEIVIRLKEILDRPDPALGFVNGELRFWLGWAQEIAGDRDGAAQSWKRARVELESLLNREPENYVMIGDLALIDAGLGDYQAALDLLKRASAAIPMEKDAVQGPTPLEFRARVEALMGDSDNAISTLRKLLSIPYDGALASDVPLTLALLRLDPMFDQIRSDPRFKELTEGR